jgi:hypothetical protein
MNKFSLSRRKILRKIAYLPVPLTFFSQAELRSQQPDTEFFISFFAQGGWDVTCFCDPKINIQNEPIITNWSNNNEIQEIGNIRYAPFADNKNFFETHAERMLIVNGIDSQTNAHETGAMVTYTGRHAEGLPSFSALHALTHGGGLSLPYVSFGSSSSFTENIIPVLMADSSQIIEVAKSNIYNVRTDIVNEVASLHKKYAEKRMNQFDQTPSNYQKISQYYDSILGSEELTEVLKYLPPEDEIKSLSALKKNILTSLALFSSGLTSTIDIGLWGFDSHTDNDLEQETLLIELEDGIDFLWDSAEKMGINDKIFLMVNSEFSRTPFYNSGNGKDHHPIGSCIFMKENTLFTNKVVGWTDEVQNSIGINPDTLLEDGSGLHLKSAHVQHSLRKYFGIDKTNLNNIYPITSEEDSVYLFT